MTIPKVILSHKRPGRVTTLNHVNDCILCVEESQYEDYRKYYPDVEILTHPDEVKGASWKRNWIYKKFGDVFMLDDNITGVMRMYTPSGSERPTKVTADVTTKWIEDFANIAKYEYGVKLFGFMAWAKPLAYKVGQPIEHNHFPQGRAFGIFEDENLYFEEIPEFAVDDVFIYLLNAYYNRYSIMDSRLAFGFNKTGVALGGLAEYRTTEVRKQNYIFLRKNFGESVIPKKPSSIRKNLNSWEQTMNIPI